MCYARYMYNKHRDIIYSWIQSIVERAANVEELITTLIRKSITLLTTVGCGREKGKLHACDNFDRLCVIYVYMLYCTHIVCYRCIRAFLKTCTCLFPITNQIFAVYHSACTCTIWSKIIPLLSYSTSPYILHIKHINISPFHHGCKSLMQYYPCNSHYNASSTICWWIA